MFGTLEVQVVSQRKGREQPVESQGGAGMLKFGDQDVWLDYSFHQINAETRRRPYTKGSSLTGGPSPFPRWFVRPMSGPLSVRLPSADSARDLSSCDPAVGLQRSSSRKLRC